MSKVLVIAEREIRERAFVFITAVALAIAPFLALLIPRGQITPPLQVVAMISAVIAAAFVVGLSILLGVSMVGRELAEKRLSFYFARPLSGRAIWMGKLAAVAAILLVCAAIAFAPAALFAPPEWGGMWSLPVSRLITITLLFSTAVFAVAHAASTMLRSRSPLILLDFAAALLFLGLVGAMLTPLLSHGAIALFVLLLTAIVAIAVAILLVAPAWQVQRARTDVRRNHFELSRFIWSCGGALLLAIALFVAWVQRVGPQDVEFAGYSWSWVQQTAAGVIISGPARYRMDYRASFVLDPQTGRSREIAAKDSWNIQSSSRGTAIIWSNSPVSVLDMLPGARTRDREWTVMSATAADQWAGHEVFAGSGSGPEGWPGTLAISDDGALALVVQGDIAAIYDVPRHRLAAAVRLPFKPYIHVEASFISPHLVRIFASGVNGPISAAIVLDVDPTTRRVHQTMALAGAGRRILLIPLAGGIRAFASWRDPSRDATVRDARIYDAATGREIAAFTGDPKPRVVRALGDGRLVSIDDNRASLRLYDANARLLRTIDLGSAADAIVRPDLVDGRVIVGTTLGRTSQPKEWTSSVVDIDRGVVARQAGLMPLRTGRFQFLPQIPVFMDEQTNLVTWDVTTNQRRVVLALK